MTRREFTPHAFLNSVCVRCEPDKGLPDSVIVRYLLRASLADVSAIEFPINGVKGGAF